MKMNDKFQKSIKKEAFETETELEKWENKKNSGHDLPSPPLTRKYSCSAGFLRLSVRASSSACASPLMKSE